MEHETYQNVFMGAEGRYEDYVYLEMLEREWLRPISDEDRFLNIPAQHRPSARAAFVMIFWTYFETRIERLFRTVPSDLTKEEFEKLLQRNATIGARLKSFYKARFSTTYGDDLRACGFEKVADLLSDVHGCRNRFAHGHPEAINDDLVERLVGGLKDEHDGWVAVLNRRISLARAGS